MTIDELIQAIRMSPEGRVRIERGLPGTRDFAAGWASLAREDSDWVLVHWDNGQGTGVVRVSDASLRVVEPFPPGLEHLAVEETMTVTLRRYLRWPSERGEKPEAPRFGRVISEAEREARARALAEAAEAPDWVEEVCTRGDLSSERAEREARRFGRVMSEAERAARVRALAEVADSSVEIIDRRHPSGTTTSLGELPEPLPVEEEMIEVQFTDEKLVAAIRLIEERHVTSLFRMRDRLAAALKARGGSCG